MRRERCATPRHSDTASDEITDWWREADRAPTARQDAWVIEDSRRVQSLRAPIGRLSCPERTPGWARWIRGGP